MFSIYIIGLTFDWWSPTKVYFDQAATQVKNCHWMQKIVKGLLTFKCHCSCDNFRSTLLQKWQWVSCAHCKVQLCKYYALQLFCCTYNHNLGCLIYCRISDAQNVWGLLCCIFQFIMHKIFSTGDKSGAFQNVQVIYAMRANAPLYYNGYWRMSDLKWHFASASFISHCDVCVLPQLHYK